MLGVDGQVKADDDAAPDWSMEAVEGTMFLTDVLIDTDTFVVPSPEVYIFPSVGMEVLPVDAHHNEKHYLLEELKKAPGG